MMTAELGDFCLTLTPTWGVAERAGHAIRERFARLPEERRDDLAAVVARLVDDSVGQRPGMLVTVTAVLGAADVHGEVAVNGDRVEFQVPTGA
jgi:hypothetical protein